MASLLVPTPNAPDPAARGQENPFGRFPSRPHPETGGIVGWLTTVDHKKIGIAYALGALFFLLLGGVEALVIRLQLMFPENDLISARTYNQMFTMHGTTMVFLAIMPLSAAFFNYFTPLLVGARDVAFPRMNALSLWTFLLGGVLINLTWFFEGGAPAIGWFGYAPLTSRHYHPDIGADFWILGLQLLGVSSMLGAFNFITTIINLRAPGMTMMRLPLFAWMTLVTSFLIILALPAISVALLQLMMDRHFDTHFFNALEGGKPILWQHLFWIFGHPEVYILILPAMGIISEILPTFARKPLFGYSLIVFSGAAIGFLGFTVWSHHMFTTGMNVVATSAFSIMTMLIAIPTGVKIFNWIGTLWGGKLRFPTPMLFALGFIWMFMMGGFTGIMHSAVPADTQQHDTYFVVAHFHYVLIGGALFALFAGLYYWMPKMSGRLMNDGLGKIVFWLMFAGFNLAFFPMHFLGLTGMPRRTHTYKAGMGWEDWNFWSTVGALILGVGIAIFVIQVVWTLFKGKRSPADPWDARTIEWATASPPPVYNFARTPIIRARDQVWENKHGKPANKMGTKADDAHGIHMPGRSWYPLIIAIGLFILCLGMTVFNYEVTYWGAFSHTHTWFFPVLGFAIALWGAFGWAHEGPGDYYIKLGRSGGEDA